MWWKRNIYIYRSFLSTFLDNDDDDEEGEEELKSNKKIGKQNPDELGWDAKTKTTMQYALTHSH